MISPISHRAAMLMHLARRITRYVLIALLAITMPLTTFGWIQPLVDYSPFALDAATFALVLILPVRLLRVCADGEQADRFHAPSRSSRSVLLLHIGLSLCCASAFLAGLTKRDATFVRTPKTGDAPTHAASAHYRSSFDPMCLLEVIFGGAYVFFHVARGVRKDSSRWRLSSRSLPHRIFGSESPRADGRARLASESPTSGDVRSLLTARVCGAKRCCWRDS